MRREFIASLGDEDIELVVAPAEPGIWSVEIDGELHRVDARQVGPRSYSLLVAGRSHLVHLDQRVGLTAFSVGSERGDLRLSDSRRHRLARLAQSSGGAAESGELVTAPIAGKVVKVLVTEGEQVAAGAGVVVLEAMKMENELKAERGGTVAQIHVAAGQAIETGELLVTLV